MKTRNHVLLLTMITVMFLLCPAYAEVEMSTHRSFEIEGVPVDIAVSPNGQAVYVLTEEGDLHIYSMDGKLIKSFSVDKSITGIKAYPQEGILLLTSRNNKTVQLVSFDNIVEISDSGSPFKGPEEAPVEIVLFSEFQCPYCASLAPLLDKVIDEYTGKVKLVFKNYPLRNHTFSLQAAMAALAADEQGRFWEFYNLLFQSYNLLNEQKIQDIVAELGLDKEKFESDRVSPMLMQKIREDVGQALEAGVTGTPSLFINGKAMRSISIESIRKEIEKEVAECTEEEKKDTS